MKLFTRTTATGLLAIGLTLGVGATAAFAGDDPGPIPNSPSEQTATHHSKKRCINQIRRRVVDLAKWSVQVHFRMNLTAAQKNELLAELSFTSNGLINTAFPAVQGATTKAELRAACNKVFTDYRVYLVVHPRVFITSNAWGWSDRIDDLQAKAAALAAQGKVSADANALLAHAETLAMPIHDQLDGITPASYNAAPNATKALFKSAKNTLKTVKSEVQQAAKLLRQLAKT